MTTKRNDGDPLVPLEGLAEERITRARAIKLAGAMVGTGAFALLLPDEADARKRRRRKRRRRARVAEGSSTPVVLNVSPEGGVLNPTIGIENPSPDRPLTISEVKVIDGNGAVIETVPLVGGPVTIRPGETANITPDLSGLSLTELLRVEGFRLLDGTGTGITVIDENGVQVGDIPVDVNPL